VEATEGYDSQPHGGQAPTSLWQAGALMIDSIAFPIATHIPNGTDYRLGIGLYDATTMERLLLVDEHGTPFADQVVIAPIRIEWTVPGAG